METEAPIPKHSTIHWHRVGEFDRAVVFHPAYDFRNHPAGNYGIHGVALRFLLRGDHGAVQFILFTDWQLPSARESVYPWDMVCRPTAADLGYHSRTQMYEGQTTIGPCTLLDGDDCYYEGSTLNAEPVFERLIAEGSDGVWDALESYYRSIFPRDDGVA